jgi:hypothetical protein
MDHGSWNKGFVFSKKNYIKKLANFFPNNLAKLVEFTHNKRRTPKKKNPRFLKGKKKQQQNLTKKSMLWTLALMEVQNPMDKVWITSVAIGNGTPGLMYLPLPSNCRIME